MHVHELMSQPAAVCHVNDSLNIAAQLMWEHDCGALPVVDDDGVLAGMITDRDMCMAAYTQGRALDDILVNSAMARHVISAHAELGVGDAAQLMAQHQIRRLPVIDGDGRPIGIISLNDLAIECVQPDTAMKHGPQKIAHALAAICQPRAATQRAA